MPQAIPAIASIGSSIWGAIGGAKGAATIGANLLPQVLGGNDAGDAYQAAGQQYTDYYREVSRMLAPRIAASDSAVNQMMTELGLSPASGGAGGGGGTTAPRPDFGGYLQDNPDVAEWAGTLSPEDRNWIAQQGYDTNRDGAISPEEAARFHYNEHGEGEGRTLNMFTPGGGGQGGAQGGAEGDRFARFRETPGYQFVREEGLRAVEESAASRGRLLSGRTLEALQERGSGIADTTYQNYFARLASLAGLGNQALGIASNVGLQQAEAQSNLALGQGLVGAQRNRELYDILGRTGANVIGNIFGGGGGGSTNPGKVIATVGNTTGRTSGAAIPNIIGGF